MQGKKNTEKQLLKILIGAAWIDGHIQTEERQYLQKTAQKHNLADDPEIRPLLNELKAVKPDQCYAWVQEYLGSSPNQKDYENLIEAISGLIYSDGEMATEEAKLLTSLQEYDPDSTSPLEKVLKTVQTLYQRYANS
ncbi:TerB family tellurite resistance protein [Euhalothece natronophila Z-M001]|uniref:TerB family tellurite resistance protein n=1 Tax=Euhalothece natronophila Z-M001 TaxID=522448 RepID=A0A5B8NJ97_9CHRO|nr:TerB family tellurite resistance protein [Euhalothece natronophila]QDZ39027.1 TerB family tellurite resistance protein [Euhalothece natronophila Z-M001]